MSPKLTALTSPSAEAWLIHRLSAVDDPLPTVAELALKLEDPLTDLNALALGPTSRFANNAIVLLGEYDGTALQLIEIAADESLTPMTRASAASGLARVPVKDRVQATSLLVTLTRHSNVTLAANAASACVGLPDATDIFTDLVNDPSSHPAVQRYAKGALDAHR